MPLNILPVSVDVLRAISEQTDTISAVFERRSEAFSQLRSLLRNPAPFSQNEDFLASPMAVRYFQIWLLLGLSMHGGILIPPLTHQTQKGQKLKLHWQGVSQPHEWSWGSYDSRCVAAASHILSRLLGARYSAKECSPSVFDRLHKLTQQYNRVLTETNKVVEAIHQRIDTVKKILQKDISGDLLFILMAAFPTEDLNNFFLYIQQFFPADLTIKTPNGHRMTLCSLFESPASDIAFLIEKLRIYFELYVTSKMPIIKEITQSKTRDYILNQLSNPRFSSSVRKNLAIIKSSQIDTRLGLYSLYHKHLQLLRAR